MAASPQRIPNIVILRYKMVVGFSLKAFGEQLEAIYAQSPGGGEAKIESARETTLQDGVTKAMEFLVQFSLVGVAFRPLTLFVQRGPQTVQVAVTWMDAVGDRASLKVDEIVYSLYFK